MCGKLRPVINRKVSAGEIPPIRALILNAGHQEMDEQRFTEEGLATVFVANYLGHWLLVLLLLRSMDRERGRIVVLGSRAHEYGPVSQSLISIIKDEGWNSEHIAECFMDEMEQQACFPMC
jgi:NAD(P)-dependent dehydrogenase (short-subunit alcohol dehydrogenase family)